MINRSLAQGQGRVWKVYDKFRSEGLARRGTIDMPSLSVNLSYLVVGLLKFVRRILARDFSHASPGKAYCRSAPPTTVCSSWGPHFFLM